MSTSAISFVDLGHAYTDGNWVFKGYSGEIERGSVFSILGPNGSGKTTLLNILIGAVTPTAGTFRMLGHVAFVPQLFQAAFDYSVLDMVVMGRARHVSLFKQPSPTDIRAAVEALERLGIKEYAARRFHELSGGERQLVILARALASEASILILDEPTSSLDLKNQVLVLRKIRELSAQYELTIVFTTHYPAHALAAADHTMLFIDAERNLIGKTRSVMTEENLEHLYRVPIKYVSARIGETIYESLLPILDAGRP